MYSMAHVGMAISRNDPTLGSNSPCGDCLCLGAFAGSLEHSSRGVVRFQGAGPWFFGFMTGILVCAC